MSEIKLIVGLGNPGEKYADTRHNAGEWLIQRLAKQFGFSLKEESNSLRKRLASLFTDKRYAF